MAEIQSHMLPLTPPPPAYSPTNLRSQSPHNDTYSLEFQNMNNSGFRQNFESNAALPKSVQSGLNLPYHRRASPSGETSVQIHPPEPNAFDGPVPSTIRALTPQQSLSQDPTRLSPSPQVLPRRKAVVDSGRNTVNPVHRRIVSENPQQRFAEEETYFRNRASRHASASMIESDLPAEQFEPLQYHHQAFDDPDMKALNQRASKMTIGTVHSDGSGKSDNLGAYDAQGAFNARNSAFGKSLQRPDSGFASNPDGRGRTDSPSLSPARPLSRHSRSPDARPLSYVDLLNVPYPQSAPSGAENLVNAQLRSAVGNNASLLSTRKTLEMYRANVKKTNDPAIQYEFAVFMISAAQEEGLETENVSESGLSDKSHASIRDDLLKEAKHILQKLCDRSYPFAQYYLADGYASGLFNKGREDWDRAFPLFLAASKHGHAEAGYRTALCHEFGWGCRVDGLKAVQFYQHAASKNHPGAMLRLGRACLTGDMGLTNRYREGIRWLKRGAESADRQYNQAPYDLACLHETGFGPDVFKDESYAAQLYTKAADLGHVEANYRLGEAYEFGQLNCPKDPALSLHFYTGAAERGHAPAQMALCAWYMAGIQNVLEKDPGEAYEWARKAAQNGLAKAQFTLGYFTEMGIGCRRDPLEANVWYVRAADQGEERAKHRIAAIRAAATGANPVTAASGKRGKLTASNDAGNVGPQDNDKKKRFGIF